MKKNKADRKDLMKQLQEGERAFLNPEEWGIDLRPIFKDQLDLPVSPEKLMDHEVRACLRSMVLILAEHHLCLTNTNHMSDRALYSHIMERILPEPLGVGPNPIGGLIYQECCPCDVEDYFRYFADDFEREEWRSMTDEPLPEKQPLVSDRDLWLETIAEAHRDRPLPPASAAALS